MNFNKHSALEGQHAFLGASQYHWINYDENKLAESYSSFLARQKGTILHDFAAQCIKLGQKLPKSKKTLNQYVNDAIGFNMTPEQILVYSVNCLVQQMRLASKIIFLEFMILSQVKLKPIWNSLWFIPLFSVWNMDINLLTLKVAN